MCAVWLRPCKLRPCKLRLCPAGALALAAGWPAGCTVAQLHRSRNLTSPPHTHTRHRAGFQKWLLSIPRAVLPPGLPPDLPATSLDHMPGRVEDQVAARLWLTWLCWPGNADLQQLQQLLTLSQALAKQEQVRGAGCGMPCGQWRSACWHRSQRRVHRQCCLARGMGAMAGAAAAPQTEGACCAAWHPSPLPPGRLPPSCRSHRGSSSCRPWRGCWRGSGSAGRMPATLLRWLPWWLRC
jgi:hypothetical protein